MTKHAALDWSAIDTVLLDMDGTLLDQRFDNWFWQEHVPSRFGQINGITDEAAWALIAPKFRAVRGTIQWYCIDYWSEELKLDIAAIKRTDAGESRLLAGRPGVLVQAQVERKAPRARDQRAPGDPGDQE